MTDEKGRVSSTVITNLKGAFVIINGHLGKVLISDGRQQMLSFHEGKSNRANNCVHHRADKERPRVLVVRHALAS